MKYIALIGLLGVLAVAGCDQKMPSAPPPASSAPHMPTHAQDKLPTIRLWLGASEVSAEMALTGKQEQTGMMFRTNLDENSGMIFVLSQPQHAAFWMTNCPLPLAAAYINPKGEIEEIHELHANDANSVVADAPDILFVLEMNQGWFDRHHIGTGTVVLTEKGTLLDTFVRRNP